MKKEYLVMVAPLAVLGLLAGAFWFVPSIQPATSTELAEVAVGFYKGQQSAFAQDTLREALKLDPSNARANYVAGVMALQEERLNDAIRYLDAAFKAKPDDWEAALSLGVAHQRVGHFPVAKSLYAKIRAAQPENAKAAYNLGMLEMELTNFVDAKRYLEEYLTLMPDAADQAEVEKTLDKIAKRLGRPSGK